LAGKTTELASLAVPFAAAADVYYIVCILYYNSTVEMRMVRWTCGIKLKDRFPSKELRERLGVDDIALVLQQNRLHWYGHVLRKEDDDWVKKCMEY